MQKRHLLHRYSGSVPYCCCTYYNAIYETSSVLDITSGGNKPLYALSRCYDKLSETSEDIEQIAQFRQMAEDYKYQAEQWKFPDEIV